MRWVWPFVLVLVVCRFIASAYAMQEPFYGQGNRHSPCTRKRDTYAQMPDPSSEKMAAMVDPTVQKVSGADEQERVRVGGSLSALYVTMNQACGENNVKKAPVPLASKNRVQVSGQTELQDSALVEPAAPCALIQNAFVSMVHCLCTKPRPLLTVDTSCRDESVVQVTVDTSRHDESVAQAGASLSIMSRSRDYCKKFWDWVISSNGDDSSFKQEGEEVLSESSDDSDSVDGEIYM